MKAPMSASECVSVRTLFFFSAAMVAAVKGSCSAPEREYGFATRSNHSLMLGVVPTEVVEPADEAGTEVARGLGRGLGSSLRRCVEVVYLVRLDAVSETRPSWLTSSLWGVLGAGGASEAGADEAGADKGRGEEGSGGGDNDEREVDGDDKVATLTPLFGLWLSSVFASPAGLNGTGVSARSPGWDCS